MHLLDYDLLLVIMVIIMCATMIQYNVQALRFGTRSTDMHATS